MTQAPDAANHPANAGLRAYREPRHLGSTIGPLAYPADIPRPYEQLGTHPDLVARLWDELPRGLPVDCRAVFFGAPVLMHPLTQIVFAFAGGTHAYALRLPPDERAAALRAGAKAEVRYSNGQSLLLSEIGPEWMFGGWFRDEEAWCIAAFEAVGQL